MTTSITLIDPESQEQVTVEHAVPSGKARVAVAKLAAVMDAVDDKQKSIVDYVIRKGGDDQGAVIKAMLEDGAITIDDVLRLNAVDAERVERDMQQLFQLFRIAANTRQMTTEWKARIDNDEWMAEQNVQEVTAFVTTFRASLGV